MPYKLRQSKGKWCVAHADTGKHEKGRCHTDKTKAISQLRVLNQAYSKEKK